MNVALSGRIKHGDLFRAMRERGWNQRQLGEFLGMSVQHVGALLNLKWIPKRVSKELEAKLFELTGKLVDDLWPEWSRQAEFLSASKSVEMFADVARSSRTPDTGDEADEEDDRFFGTHLREAWAVLRGRK